MANIEEDKIRRVRIDQPVEVYVESLDRTLLGRVRAISPVTASTLLPLPEQRSSGNLRRSLQVIPIKISLDEVNLSLIPGSSAEIQIRIR